MDWQFYIVGALISAVIFTQCYKVAVRETKNDGAATVLMQIITGASVLLYTPLFEYKFSTDWKLYTLFLIACIFYALNDRLKTTARKHLEVSEYVIVSQLNSVFMILIGLMFFQNPVVLTRILGGALIIGASMFLVYEKRKFIINKYMWIAIVAALFMAIAFSIDIDISKHFNLPIYISMTLLVPALLMLLFTKVTIRDVVDEIKRPVRKFYVITGILWGLWILLAIRAYQLVTASVATPLLSIAVLLNVITAWFFLKEKNKTSRKIISALIIIAGVYLTILK